MTNAQKIAEQMGYALPSTDQERRAVNAGVFDRFAAAALKSGRSDAAALSAHYTKRAASQR